MSAHFRRLVDLASSHWNVIGPTEQFIPHFILEVTLLAAMVTYSPVSEVSIRTRTINTDYIEIISNCTSHKNIQYKNQQNTPKERKSLNFLQCFVEHLDVPLSVRRCL